MNNKVEEIDIKALINILKAGKWLIIVITSCFILISLVIALSMPNVYKSSVLLVPAEQKNGGAGAISGSLSGLASLAGVSLGGSDGNKVGLALEILRTKDFIFRFINKHNLLPELMAAKGWDPETNQIKYNDELFNNEQRKWLADGEGDSKKPSLQKAYVRFMQLLVIKKDNKKSTIEISFKYYSPILAKKWLDLLVIEINNEIKTIDLSEAEYSLTFLDEQLKKTNVNEYRDILYKLIEEHSKVKMFANVRPEYVLKTIDPSIIPEEKYEPKRAIILVLGALVGIIVSLAFVLLSGLRERG